VGHTYILEPGLWVGEGSYAVEGGPERPATGEAHVSHAGGLWSCSARIQLEGAGGRVACQRRYVIEPFAPGAQATTWHAEHPEYGLLEGQLAIVDDTVIELFRSRDGHVWGGETRRQLAPHLYKARGFVMQEGRLAGRWFLTLTRVVRRAA